MRRARAVGLTLLEVLVAVATMSVLLGIVAIFFNQQRQHSERVEARSEVRAKARTIGEVVAQDLELTGATATVAAGSPTHGIPRDGTTAATTCSALESQGCITLAASAPKILTIWYRSSLGAHPCHRVDYYFDGTNEVLYRSDVSKDNCDALPSSVPAIPPDSTSTMEAVAHRVTSFAVTFTCDDGRAFADPSGCYTPDADGNPSFLRTAHITVAALSDDTREAVTSTFDFDAPMPNIRAPDAG